MKRALPGRERLTELVAGLAGQPLIMGVDLVADRFISGTPKRISREAPVLILRLESDEVVPGGGANAVANVAALGGRPMPLGVVGRDESGRVLLEKLANLAVPLEGIVRLAGYRTPTKTRVLGGGRHAIKQQIVRYDSEDRVAASAEIDSTFSRALERWRGTANVAVLSDYGYGGVVPELVPQLRQVLGSGGVVLCDSRFRLAEFTGVDGATPNEEEAEALAGRRFGDEPQELVAAGGELRDRLGTAMLLVTRGSRGMSLFEPGGATHIPVHGTDQVADVTGAGDTVIGVFALALAAGGTPLEAALLANYAGGVVVRKLGTATLTAAELAAALADPAPLAGARWDES